MSARDSSPAEPMRPVAEVLLISRGQGHSVTNEGDRTSSAIHRARKRHPFCTILQVRKWVAKACTGTGGGMGGANIGGASTAD